MKLGIKVNADTDSFDRLANANPQLAEVWFNVNDADRYTELFSELTKRGCDVGLHFWGTLDDGVTSANIAYPDKRVINQSMRSIKKTIDIAAQNKFQYVNIHPGMRVKTKVNFDANSYDRISDPVEESVSLELFLTHTSELSEYAKNQGVVFTVETVPPRITRGWYDPKTRLAPENIYELPVSAIVAAAQRGLWVANDFCHSAANIITDDPHAVWTFLYGVTMQLATQTRLIHLGFVMPPYNGTDNHDSFDNPIFDSVDAVPNKTQTIELLKLFAGRDDIWALAEPSGDHVKNFFLVQKLLEQAAQN